MEQLKQDLSRKDTELLGLQTKLETLTNQFSDSKQHIEVLKESLTAKEQRAAILQTEVQHLLISCPEDFGIGIQQGHFKGTYVVQCRERLVYPTRLIVLQTKAQKLPYVKDVFLFSLLLNILFLYLRV